MKHALPLGSSLIVLLVGGCEDAQQAATTEEDQSTADSRSALQDSSGLEGGMVLPESSELPEVHRIAIEEAKRNGNELTGDLNRLLDAIESGVTQSEVEKEFGQPHSIEDGVATYRDDRLRIPVYANLSGVTAVMLRYADDGTAVLVTSAWQAPPPESSKIEAEQDGAGQPATRSESK